ncbi:MAG: replication-associated recombination protein A [Flavobacteriales bacterium]|nr:replication-associated recombination protein A [Flavobacteriales bacterium]
MKNTNVPLAERVRPVSIKDFIGQEHLLAKGQPIQKLAESKTPRSILFWGPPGVGKTTLAGLLAESWELPFFSLSAINSGVKDLREVIDKAAELGGALLFIDEIHRFNKSQQDAILGAVEKGVITLIGATTENPGFEVINALLSRSQVYTLNPFDDKHLGQILQRAMEKDEYLRVLKIKLTETEALFRYSGGDGRKLLNLFDLVVQTNLSNNAVNITNKSVETVLQQKMALYDKGGEQHYDIISAFIKSIRGSDPNASVYWLARMLEGGEDIKFIARRMVILASEDIGNANPNALLMATQCFQAITMIGMPEARIILSQTVIYLACSVKSNASYKAIETAAEMVRKTGGQPVPLALRNPVTKMMKNMGYGKEYKYAHGYENNFVDLEFLPENLKGQKMYDPSDNPRELEMRKFLRERWGKKYGY